jgi:aminoglycoside phosphotransferase (APT) family kinase protein
MSTRQDQFSGTKDIDPADAINTNALDEYLQANVVDYQGPLTLKQFKGGQSNPTYLLQASSGDYVMRRKPSGKLLKSAHAVDREYRIMTSLHSAGFPVPRTYALCEDESVIGTMFFVMEYVEGRIFWDLDLPDCERDERTAIYDQVNQTFAQLHNFDYTLLGLDDFGKPGNYFSRQISRWSGQYAASETSKIPAMNRLINWLPDNIPGDESTSVVHGDFRLDNMVIHPTEPRVLAVLDWELSTIGHPLGDFTYHLMPWQIPDFGIGSSGLKGKNLAELGIPSEDDYIASYCERTGRSDGISDRDFYSAYNFFRIAAILQGIAGRVRDGTAASAYAERAAKAVEPLAEMGWQFASRQG